MWLVQIDMCWMLNVKHTPDFEDWVWWGKEYKISYLKKKTLNAC